MLDSNIAAFIAIILGFGVLIFVHELGHFLVAKWVNIRCQQFAIGFGPAMLAYRKGIGIRSQSTNEAYEAKIRQRLRDKGLDPEQTSQRAWLETGDALGLGETEYRLNYIPLGGYVKMLGQEDLDPNAQSDDPRAYNQKPIWARACVLSAGVVMNVIFGFLFFIVAFMMGVEFPTTSVGAVQPARPAAMTYAQGHQDDPAYRGLRVGDTVTHVNGEPVKDFMDLNLGIALAPENSDVTLTVNRDGRQLTYKMQPTMTDGAELPTIGIQPMRSLQIAALMPSVNEDTAPELARLKNAAADKTPMRAVRAGDQRLKTYTDLQHALAAAKGEPVDVTFQQTDRKGQPLSDAKTVTVSVAAEPTLTRAAYAGDETEPPANLIGLTPATRIDGFPDPEQGESPARDAGVQPGDLVASLQGEPWPTTEQLLNIIDRAAKDDRPVSMTVYRDGAMKTFDAIELSAGRLGIYLSQHLRSPVVGRTMPGSPSAALDLPGGSRITAIAGEPVDSWASMQRRLKTLAAENTASDKPVTLDLTYELSVAGQPVETTTLELDADHQRHLVAAGWRMPGALVFDTHREPLIATGPLNAAALGLQKTNQFIVNTYYTLLRLIQGALSPEAVRGPVGIVDAGTTIAKRGVSWFLYFLGLISINLAVINFLPIPILDGGHIVFLIIEKIKGSPPSPAVQNAALFAGLALIGSVFLLVTYNDIARLITGG